MAAVEERYGEALIELADTEEKLNCYFEEAKLLKGLLAENPELFELFLNPKISIEEKKDVINKCFSGRLSDDITGLIALVVTNGRADRLYGILDYFISAAKERMGIAVVYVSSAQALDETIKRSLEAKLIATTSYRKLEMHYAVDESLIGGMTVRLKDRIIDNTIKTKLALMQKELRG